MFWTNLSVVGQIIWVNVLLSADNVVVIAAVAHGLPQAQRRMALVGGTFFAVALRILLTSLVGAAFAIKGVQLLGGLILIPIAAKLLIDEPDTTTTAAASQTNSLARAMTLILVADLLMSFDNILAVAAVAKSNLPVLVGGLVVSIVIIMVCGGLISTLIDRWKWLTYAGAAFLAARFECGC